MRKVTLMVLVLGLTLGLLSLPSCGKDNCLKRKGYSSCEDLKSAFNLQDKDEAIRYLDIAKQCGCWELKQ
jgi:hypothetical protein